MDTWTTGTWRIAPDAVLVPVLEPLPSGCHSGTHSMVVTGQEPVLVDTGAAEHRERWIEGAFSAVEPRDVRWIFLSHDGSDHAGNLDVALEMCPAATLVTARVPRDLTPPGRLRRIADGESFDAGDRRLTAVRPPLHAAPATLGLYDDRSGVYWAADCFGAHVPIATADAADLAPASYLRAVRAFNARLAHGDGRAADRLAAMEIVAIATAHGPTATGALVPRVIDVVRDLVAAAPAGCGP